MKIRPNEKPRGFITIIALTLVLLMVLLLSVDTASVNRVRREIKNVEKNQIHRLGVSTNQPAAKAISR